MKNIEDYKNENEFFLKTASTRQLVALKKKLNHHSDPIDAYTDFDNPEIPEINVMFVTKGGIKHDVVINIDELKDELATRENIPSSIESRKIRQNLAKKYRKGKNGKKDK
jgi:hypothetical protein